MTLDDFLKLWCSRIVFRMPAETPLDMEGRLHGVVLYRDAPWQVQLFSVSPNGEIPDHIHPNVDSYEIYLSGEIAFRHSGIYITTPEMWVDTTKLFGLKIRVLPNDSHGGSFGPKGGAFLSIQHWLNNVPPSSVGYDWAYTSDDTRAKSYVNA